MLEALQTLLDNGLPEKAILPIITGLFEGNGIENDDVKRLALLYHRAKWGGDFDCDIKVATYNGCVLVVGNHDYLVLDEGERESRWDDALESLLDDCIEGADGPYFDREAWKRDARFDGAGPCLASYDGAEEEVDTSKAGAGWYYIYRIN